MSEPENEAEVDEHDQDSLRSGSENLKNLEQWKDLRHDLVNRLEKKISEETSLAQAEDAKRKKPPRNVLKAREPEKKEEFVNKIVVNLERVLIGLDTRITQKSGDEVEEEPSRGDVRRTESTVTHRRHIKDDVQGKDQAVVSDENASYAKDFLSETSQGKLEPVARPAGLKPTTVEAHPDRDWLVDLFHSLDSSVLDDKDNYWVKIPLGSVHRVGLDQLMKASDTGFNYKLTVRSVHEIVETTEDKKKQHVSRAPSIVIEPTEPESTPTETTERVDVSLVLNEVQLVALRKMYRMGFDLKQLLWKSIWDFLHVGDEVYNYDWETLVTRNLVVNIAPPEIIQYERDQSRRNPEELTRAVERYLAQVLPRQDVLKSRVEFKPRCEKFGKVVLKIRCPTKDVEKTFVRYIVLDQNTSLLVLKEIVRKHLLGKVKRLAKSRVELFLSDDDESLHDDLCVGDLRRIDENYQIISLKVNMKTEVEKSAPVQEKEEPCKPYVDNSVKGYRNKQTNVIYYNACSQTSRPLDLSGLVSREAQTPALPLQDAATSSVKETWTQMSRDDFVVDEREDRILCAKEWVLDPAFEPKYRLEMVKLIQDHWRNYLLLKHEQDLKGLVTKLKDNEQCLVHKMGESLYLRQIKRMLSPLFLNKKQDALMLYVFLDTWWTNTKKHPNYKTAIGTLRRKTNSVKCRNLERGAASRVVLKEYESLLNHLVDIEKNLRIWKNLDGSIRLLNESTKPLRRKDDKGSIETVESQRALQLKHLYTSLRKRDLTIEERVDLLLHIKQLLLDEDLEPVLTQRLLSLIQKEVDYMSLDVVRGPCLDTLRKRTELHFLKYITSPKVNPNIGKILEQPAQELLQCDHCLKLKGVEHLQTERFSSGPWTCKDCYHIRQIGKEGLVDSSLYTHMLTLLREEELRRCSLSPLPFLINEETVHTILKIWGFHSPITECRDLSKLRLTRWITHEDWTPWNNILLTDEEALSHSAVKQLGNVYSAAFIHQVWRKNTAAHGRLESLRKMEYCVKHILSLTCQEQDDYDEVNADMCLDVNEYK